MKAKLLFLAAAGLLAACNEEGDTACTIEDADDGRVLRCPDGSEAPLGAEGASSGDGGSGDAGDGTPGSGADGGAGNETAATDDGGLEARDGGGSAPAADAGGTGADAGPSHDSCSIEASGDGQYTLRCPDGSEATLAGTTADETDCVVQPDGQGGLEVRCDDGSTTPLGNTYLGSTPDGGPAGGSCTATLEGNIASVRCDDGSNFTFLADTVVQGPDVLLLSPGAGPTFRSRPTFDWSDAATAGARYRVEIARDVNFEDVVLMSDPLESSEFRPAAPLLLEDTLYWRVHTLAPGGVVLATTAARWFRSGFDDYGWPYVAYAWSGQAGLLIALDHPGLGGSLNLDALPFVRTRHGRQSDYSDADSIDHGAVSETVTIELPPADGEIYYLEVVLYDPDGDHELVVADTEVLHDTVPPEVGDCALADGASSVATTHLTWPCEASDGSGTVRFRTYESPDCTGSSSTRPPPEIPWLHFSAFDAAETATLEGSMEVVDAANNRVCIHDSVQLSRTFLDLGQVLTDQTLAAGNYYLTDDFQVAEDATLTLAPGVTLASARYGSARGTILGTLVAEGTAGSPVVLQNLELQAKTASLAHVLATEATVGSWGSAVEIRDSRLTSSHVRGNQAILVHNVLHQSYVYLECVNGLELTENRFDAAPLVLECFAPSLAGDSFAGNSFLNLEEARAVFYSDTHLVSIGGQGDVDLQSNYWGTTEPSVIAEAIFDGADELGRGMVDASNPLSEPHPNAP